jgi:hypothetical protein
MRSTASGVLSAATAAALSLLITSGGVPAGAKIACMLLVWKPG